MFGRVKHVACLLGLSLFLTSATTKTWPGGATNTSPTSFSIPGAGDQNWASLSNFLIAIANSAQSTTIQKIAVRRATATPVTVSATTDCVIVTALTAPGAVAVTLPTAATKQVFVITDGTGDAATNNITITPASGNINGASTYVIDKNNAGIMIVYDGTQWTVISEFNALSGSGSSTILTKTNTVTAITNKSFSDSTTTIEDNSDNTKKLAFQVSGVTTGNTRTLTVPDASTTIAGTDATQTLTNKTMDNTNTVEFKDTLFTLQDDGDSTRKAQFQLGSLTSATALFTLPSGNTTLAGLTNTQALSNKTLGNTNTISVKDTLFTLQDDADTTKQLQFQMSGVTTTTTRTATVPDADFTITGTGTTQTLTNKTIDADSNTLSNIENADIKSGAAIARNKIANATASYVVINDGSGTLSEEAALSPARGGTGVANGSGETLTLTGDDTVELVTTANSSVTLPTTGTLATLAGSETFTNKALTSPALTTPSVAAGSYVNMLTQAATRYNDDSGGDYVAIVAPTGVTTHTLTLPAAQGAASTVLANNGSGALSWASVASSTLNAGLVDIGNDANARTATNTALLGDISATTLSQTYAVTAAAPGVFTVTTAPATGTKAYVTVTQNGFTANTTYYVTNVSGTEFKLATTLANARSSTNITSSGTTAGTVVTGGFMLGTQTARTPGTVTNDSATAGYVGEILSVSAVESDAIAISNTATVNITGGITLTPGDWMVGGSCGVFVAATTSLTTAICAYSNDANMPGNDTMAVPDSTGQYKIQNNQAVNSTNRRGAFAMGPYRVSVAFGATVSLRIVMYSEFITSTAVGFGLLQARRIR